MLAENDIVLKMHNVHNVFWVVLLQKLEDFQLDTGLVNVLLLILHDLDCHFGLGLVVKTF